MFLRPKNEAEFKKREAIGIIRASRFVRKFAKSSQTITLTTICKIHREIFKDVWPEVGGEYRKENVKITDSSHLPPHYSKVPELMKIAETELQERLDKLEKMQGFFFNDEDLDDEKLNSIDNIIETGAWLHHTITYIHPFLEGNGRTARLAANLIFERYGLIGISVKIEKENKTKYRQALAQIDNERDYEPLKNLIYEGLIDRYDGVKLKYYDCK